MSWVKADKYSAIIGGCHFQNVPCILEKDGEPLVTIKRHATTHQVGVDANILDETGEIIAEVRGDRIEIHRDKYKLLKDENRASIIEESTGKVLYDFLLVTRHPDLDFRLSIISHLPNGLPVFLHPNRIKIGSSNILKPHISSLKLLTEKGKKGPALKIIVRPETKTQPGVFVPRAPMVGPRGVVANLLATGENRLEKGMSVLKLAGPKDHAPNLSFEGPCYFLDVAFENFTTAISFESK